MIITWEPRPADVTSDIPLYELRRAELATTDEKRRTAAHAAAVEARP